MPCARLLVRIFITIYLNYPHIYSEQCCLRFRLKMIGWGDVGQVVWLPGYYNIIVNRQQMSIYSGLATREDETNYNKLLTRLVSTMQDHIIELSNGIIASHFASKYTKLIAKMQTYEEHKYLPPKFSTILKPIEEAMRETLLRKTKNDLASFNFKLEAVKEQQQMPSSRRLNKYKTDAYMKKSLVKNKRIIQKEHLLTENLSQEKEQNIRSRSVFSEKKPRVETQFAQAQKLKTRETMADFNYKRSSEVNSSSGSRQKKINRHIWATDKSIPSKGKNLMKALAEAANKPT